MTAQAATRTAVDPVLAEVQKVAGAVEKIGARTTRIETLLAGADMGDEGFVKITNKRLDNHGSRIRRLEWAYASACGAVGLLFWMLSHHVV